MHEQSVSFSHRALRPASRWPRQVDHERAAIVGRARTTGLAAPAEVASSPARMASNPFARTPPIIPRRLAPRTETVA